MCTWKDTCPLRPESELASVPEKELYERLKENGLIVSRTTSISMTNKGSVKKRRRKEQKELGMEAFKPDLRSQSDIALNGYLFSSTCRVETAHALEKQAKYEKKDQFLCVEKNPEL